MITETRSENTRLSNQNDNLRSDLRFTQSKLKLAYRDACCARRLAQQLLRAKESAIARRAAQRGDPVPPRAVTPVAIGITYKAKPCTLTRSFAQAVATVPQALLARATATGLAEEIGAVARSGRRRVRSPSSSSSYSYSSTSSSSSERPTKRRRVRFEKEGRQEKK